MLAYVPSDSRWLAALNGGKRRKKGVVERASEYAGTTEAHPPSRPSYPSGLVAGVREAVRAASGC